MMFSFQDFVATTARQIRGANHLVIAVNTCLSPFYFHNPQGAVGLQCLRGTFCPLTPNAETASAKHNAGNLISGAGSGGANSPQRC